MKEKEILERKLATKLDNQQDSIMNMMMHITKQGAMIDDYVTPVKQLEFVNDAQAGIIANYPDHKGTVITNTIHDHAFNNFADKFNVPAAYLRRMAHGGEWERGVAAYTLNEFAGNVDRDRFLLRTTNGQMRAALSDKYRRLNSAKIFLAFLQAANTTGGIVNSAHNGDTRSWVEVIKPEVIEFDTPMNGKNYGVFGARIRNSDFGHGALELRSFMMNVVCMNGMVGETMLREVHMGGAIPETIEISDATVLKDTDARASLVTDAMQTIYSPNNMERIIETIKGASAKLVDMKKETEKLPKLGLSKAEVQQFTNVMMGGRQEDGLQGESTMWKFINGLTAVARDSEPERSRELEKIAGSMLGI